MPFSSDEDAVPLWRYPDANRFQPELELFNQHRIESGVFKSLEVASDPLEVVQFWQTGDRNVACLLSNKVSGFLVQRFNELIS